MIELSKNKIKRQCNECDVCCVVAQVKEGKFNKPACVACPYLKKKGGKKRGSEGGELQSKRGQPGLLQSKRNQHGMCSIFGDKKRPKICSTFECAWKRGFGDTNSRPDKNGVMVSINEFNGGKWIFVLDVKKDAHKTTGKSIIIDMITKFNLPAIVLDHDNLEKGKGDYVIITKEMKSRSSGIIDGFIENLGNMEIHKLRVSE